MPKRKKAKIDVSKLKKGEQLTYKELCERIGLEPILKGRAKTIQTNEIRRYLDMSFSFKTNLWTIHDINLQPTPKKSRERNGNTSDIEKILFYKLLPEYIRYYGNKWIDEDTPVCGCSGTTLQFCEWFYLFSESIAKFISFYKKNIPIYEKEISDTTADGLQQKDFEDNEKYKTKPEWIFASCACSEMYDQLRNALQSMERRKLITWRREMMIFEETYIDRESNVQDNKPELILRPATKEEEKDIEFIERSVLAEMKLKGKWQADLLGQSKTFYKKVNDELKSHFEQKFNYNSMFRRYRILLTPLAIKEVLEGRYLKLGNDKEIEQSIIECGRRINGKVLDKMRSEKFFTMKDEDKNVIPLTEEVKNRLKELVELNRIDTICASGAGSVEEFFGESYRNTRFDKNKDHDLGAQITCINNEMIREYNGAQGGV